MLLYIGAFRNMVASLGTSMNSVRIEKLLDAQLVERLLIYSRRGTPLLSITATRALWALTRAYLIRDTVFRCLRLGYKLVDETQPQASHAESLSGGELCHCDIICAKISRQNEWKIGGHAHQNDGVGGGYA